MKWVVSPNLPVPHRTAQALALALALALTTIDPRSSP